MKPVPSNALTLPEGHAAELVDGDTPPQPTSEQCSANAPIAWQGRTVYACWYPQMGGYVGRAVIDPAGPGDIVDEDNTDGCFDVWVWHDGEFPFDGPRRPAQLHHCSGEQFIRFGELALRLNAAMPNPFKGRRP